MSDFPTVEIALPDAVVDEMTPRIVAESEAPPVLVPYWRVPVIPADIVARTHNEKDDSDE